jgi:hypothetical protein
LSRTSAQGLRALGPEALALLPARGDVVERLAALWRTHVELWDLEDRARSRQASDGEIAAVKRQIDRLNGQRHRLIDALDVAVGRQGPATPVAGPARLYCQTLGELCDRLLIVELKTTRLERLVDDPTLAVDARATCEESLASQARWRAHLRACLVDQLIAQAAGRAVAPPRAEHKLYNDRRLNPVNRREDGA